MSEIERLDELRAQSKELHEKWDSQRRAVTEALYGMLELLNLGPAPLLPLREDEMVNIDANDYFGEKNILWKVRKEIYFVNQDLTKDRNWDFGSTFSLYITDKNITLNHGSSGEWGLEDKGQWSRLILMKGIFDHEQDIIDALTPLIDISVKKECYKVDEEISKINRAIEKAKDEEEKAIILSQVKPGRYLASISKRWVYKLNPDGSKNYNEGYYELYYRDFEKIYKVTDKTIITEECYNDGNVIGWQCKHHNKLNRIVNKIKYKYLAVIDDVKQTPPQPEGSN